MSHIIVTDRWNVEIHEFREFVELLYILCNRVLRILRKAKVEKAKRMNSFVHAVIIITKDQKGLDIAAPRTQWDALGMLFL
jgi:hypothetical protein